MSITLSFIPDVPGGALSLPEDMAGDLERIGDSQVICDIIGVYERPLAELILGEGSSRLDADHAAMILSGLLKIKSIPHHVATGVNHAGDAHSYVVLENGFALDPTEQGFGNRDSEHLSPLIAE